MIKVEGYKAFHGDMKIIPRNSASIVSFIVSDKDWLYKPETGCWYGGGRSFPAEICEPHEYK
jgi:hypothetical protein